MLNINLILFTRSSKPNQLTVWVLTKDTSHRFQISKRWFQKCHVALPELHPWLGFSFTQQDHLQENLTDAIWSGAMHGFFVKKNHLPSEIVKKDHLRAKMSKRTTCTVAAGAPADTWHLPPRDLAAAPAATGSTGSLSCTEFRSMAPTRKERAGDVSPAATLPGGRLC